MKEVKARYTKASKKVGEFGKLMGKISVFLDRWTQRNFKTEGDKVGGWAPFVHGGRVRSKKGKKGGLAQGITSRVFVDGSAKLLQDSGRLRASFLPFATNKKAGIGSTLPYSEPHQKGGKPWPVKRQIIPEPGDVDDEVAVLADKYLEIQLKGIGKRT